MIFATGTKLLDIKYEVYRPGGDLVVSSPRPFGRRALIDKRPATKGSGGRD